MTCDGEKLTVASVCFAEQVCNVAQECSVGRSKNLGWVKLSETHLRMIYADSLLGGNINYYYFIIIIIYLTGVGF
jgi:hypothetical protein